MRVITDLHLHSRYSRACSKELTIPNIAKACERKGIALVGTSDVTHPAWRTHIGEALEAVGNGAFILKDHSSPTRFVLTTELSCIYRRDGRTRRVHHVIVFPSLDSVDGLIRALEKRGCNLKADGRPILGLDSEVLLRLLLEISPDVLLIPAHAWTPWFSIFGSQSGFDSIEACFGELSGHIHAIETGLSSDPPMNRRWSALDRTFLVSNSDAHSLDKLGREANVFEMDEANFSELRSILVDRRVDRFIETIEFFPEEGKYHADGHRDCDFSCDPKESKKRGGICPKCGKPLTIGVWHRVDDLADRDEPVSGHGIVPHRYIIPLEELISSVLGVGPSSKKVKNMANLMISSGYSEFSILLDVDEGVLRSVASPEIVEAILAMRRNEVDRVAGYDGVFGRIRPRIQKTIQSTLY